MKKTRECMYCIHLFECDERADVEFCINFKARSEDAEKCYIEWRKDNGKTKNRGV